jgi:hypothetical protein
VVVKFALSGAGCGISALWLADRPAVSVLFWPTCTVGRAGGSVVDRYAENGEGPPPNDAMPSVACATCAAV